ncbi:MAG: serine hydrolase [Bacteroidota bacterium]
MRTLLLSALLSITASAQPTLPSLDALMADSLSQIGGGAALLVIQDGVVVHRAGYGTFTPETVEATASGAKWLAGSVIASLLSDGTLTLDDSLAMFFPALEGPKRSITVRQLFSHTSGFRGNEVSPESGCVSNPITTLERCTETILDFPLVSEPGTEFRYGGYSMQVAGRVAEIATGVSWTQLFADRITTPLGMTQTAYMRSRNPRVAGGTVTTVDDYGAFLEMVLNRGVYRGRRILTEEAVDAMLGDQTDGAEIVYSPFTQYDQLNLGIPPSRDIRYGLGVWREQIALDGSLLIGSSPGAFGMGPWIDVSLGTVGVLLVRDRGPNVIPTYVELQRRVREALGWQGTSGSTGPSAGAQLEIWPNPADTHVQVSYALRQPVEADLTVFDLLGRRVRHLDLGERVAGTHRTTLTTGGLPSGTYLLRLSAGGATTTHPLTIRR